ncbi:hypothetical protein J5069_23615 [Candidatus Symbiopectobacterium sp. NZEC127]|uniref:hypothetical protein n=1 Tax=Candidatus Symbiopectobacterium sp. NZEC127 TaxID=2820472 RepID=UPI0022261A5D|nr:hypothetical protein [Candidatus Symbiopectobacterium sp. NZEC127]MCW2488872.1 hypothetical protein [Candidatus Symbiopectobacterium sp. NZEC127]
MSKETCAYEEIINALAFYLGDGVHHASEASIREVIGQEHDPIQVFADALDDYRANIKTE